MELLTDIFADCLLDTAKTIPFLFLTYLLMEYLEHRTSDRTLSIIRRADRVGPLWGGALGVVPQCGFSAAAASLYAGRVITAGTLMAVFLSTSDEMLPIMLSNRVPVLTVVKILGTKAVIGILFGFVVDFVFRRFNLRRIGGTIRDICEHEHCGCEQKNSILRSALTHTAQIAGFLFLVTLLINLVAGLVGEDALSSLVLNRPVAGEMLAGLVGLIPNCAASVVITTLYLQGAMSAGSMIAGLLVGAGVGLLVLFRTNRGIRENLELTLILYACGVLGGLLVEVIGLRF